jgi:predicted nicotinamide N-methyase
MTAAFPNTDHKDLKHMKETAGLFVLKSKHPLLKRLRKSWPAPEIHGDKIWSSSYLIMNYLNKHPLEDGARVMEVGCGWGLLSIYCAKKFNSKVTGVDADPNVLPYLKVHSALNEVDVKTKESYYENIPVKTLKKYDAVLGGDICFWPKLVDPLYKLIKRSVKAGVGTIIIADPGRSPFLKLAKKCKKKFDAELIESTIKKPGKADGYLLVIQQ